MPVIKVNTQGVYGLSSNIRAVKRKTSDCCSDLSRVKANLDWQVKVRSNVSERISSLRRRIENQEEKLEALLRVVETAAGGFEDKDKYLRNEAKSIVYKLNACKYASANVGNAKKTTSSKSSWLINAIDGVTEMFGATSIAPISLGLIKSGASFLFNKAKEQAEELVINVGEGIKKAKNAVSAFKKRFEEGGDLYETGLYIKAGLKIAGGIAKVVAVTAGGVATGGVSAALTAGTVVYAANDIVNGIVDIANTASGNYDKVNNINVMKDAMVGVGSAVGKAFGNEDAGEVVGRVAYSTGNIVSSVYSVYTGVGKMIQSPNISLAGIKAESGKFVGVAKNTIKDISNINIGWKTGVGDVISNSKYIIQLAKYEIPKTVEAVKCVGIVTSDIIGETISFGKEVGEMAGDIVGLVD